MNYDDILTKLKKGNLAETFLMVRRKAADVGNWEIAEETERLWTTYDQMLQFMLQGVDDAQSERIRTDICQQLALVVRRLERQERLKNHAEEKYVSTRKSLANIPSFEHVVSLLESLSDEMDKVKNDELMRDSIRQHRLESLTEQYETAVLNLFNWAWTSEVWRNTDVEQANRILFSDSIKSGDKALFISATTLSLLEFIDTSKLLFLLDSYLVEDELVSQRALVGFLLVFYLHFDKIKESQDLRDRLNIYRDDASFVHDVYSTMMQLQMSCTTDSVASRMRNDIMPALMKGVMDRKLVKKKDLDPDDFVKNGENPEWMSDEKMNKKMHEMAELQLDGADIYFASFSTLKGYTFFQQMPHWFYPFSLDDIHAPELKSFSSGSMNKIVRLILNGSPFCNSDKYSLCFTFSQLGGMAESAVEAQINAQIPDGMDMDELADNAELQKPKKADIRRQYVFDLYRFYHLYPYRQQFTNPFALLKEHPVTPFSNEWLKELLTGDKEEMAQYADFLMRKEFYASALDLFTLIADNEFDPDLASIWQKIGFCHQKLDHTEEAIHAYMVANSIKPNSKWTLSHLASLCYGARRMEEAAQYYQELLELSPDNLKYLMNSAQSLMKSMQFDKAEPQLYKAFYLDEESLQAKSLLAWCLLVNEKKEDAVKLIFELQTSEESSDEAKMLLGIVMLLDGKTQEAYHQLLPLFREQKADDLQERLHLLSRQKRIKPSIVTLFMDALILSN